MNPFARVIFILVWFELGVLLAFSPWIPRLWDQNILLSRYPELIPYLLNFYMRGIVTGLGVLNMVFAAQAMFRRGHKTVASET